MVAHAVEVVVVTMMTVKEVSIKGKETTIQEEVAKEVNEETVEVVIATMIDLDSGAMRTNLVQKIHP